MRVSDLVGAEVLDTANVMVGRVNDVRMVQDFPVVGDMGAAFRVQSLIVGKHRLMAHMGLERAHIKGPWLLKAVAHRLHRDARAVPWDKIRSIEQGVIRIDGFLEDFERAHP